MEEILKQILEEQKKTNQLLESLISKSDPNQGKENMKQVYKMLAGINPQAAEMFKTVTGMK